MCYEFPPIGGGGAAVVRGLSAQLVRMGHEVDVVTMRYRGLPRRDAVDGVQVHRVPCVRLSATWCSMPEQATYLATVVPYAARLAWSRRYDITHAHFILPDGLAALLLRRMIGLPYMITSHGSDVPGYNPHRFVRAHRALAPVWRRIVARADRVVCPSRLQEELVLRGAPRARTTVIPNGIDEDPRVSAGGPKQARVLVVTRMFERKGVQYFLRALRGLELHHEVHIVGDGPFLPSLKALARELGVEVRFWGWLDRGSKELRELYQSAEIYVFPSEAENFPMVLLEAMRAGAAIITTKGTGCAEVVGDTALLVEPRNPEAIRAALVRLLGDPGLCRRLGSAAQTRLRNNFTWPAVARRYVETYLASRPLDGIVAVPNAV